MRITDKKKRERGTQIVELAAVLPLLVFLALAASEGAGVIRAHQVLNNAAREGARLSSVKENAGNTQFLQDSVTCYLIRNRVAPPAGQVPSYCPATASATTNCKSYAVSINQAVLVSNGGTVMPASQVTVSCGYPLNFLPRLPWFGVNNVVTLGGQAEFRNFWTNE